MEEFLKALLELLNDPNQSEETKQVVRELLEAERRNNEKLWKQLEEIVRKRT